MLQSSELPQASDIARALVTVLNSEYKAAKAFFHSVQFCSKCFRWQPLGFVQWAQDVETEVPQMREVREDGKEGLVPALTYGLNADIEGPDG